jgi:hypothetical protein
MHPDHLHLLINTCLAAAVAIGAKMAIVLAGIDTLTDKIRTNGLWWAVPSRSVLRFSDAFPGCMMLSDQAARSMI